MVRKSFGVLIILFVFSRIGLAQISISIDAQKDVFYNQLSSPEEGYLTISHSDFLPFSGHKPTGDTDLINVNYYFSSTTIKIPEV